MSITKKGSRSSGGSLPGGLKMATGIIYLDANGSAEGIWKPLNNSDHETYNIDGVSQIGGNVIIDYTSLGLTKVVSFEAIPDETLLQNGIQIGCGGGLTATTCSFFKERDYSTIYFASYNGASWAIQQYGGAVSDTPSISGFNPATGVLGTSFTRPFGHPVMDIKIGGIGYPNYRVVEFDAGYSFTSATFKLIDWAGGIYTPVNGDWFIFERKSQWILSATAPETTSPTSIFTAAPKTLQLSTFNDIPVSGGGTFTNFQFKIFGK